MMQYILSRNSRRVLSRLANERTLCVFDFDGTLAPIVADPDKARMRDRTCRLLRELASHYPCVVISGRSRSDVLDRLCDAKLARIIGNHGAETERTTRKTHRRVQQWHASMKLKLLPLPGLWIEDKGLSLAVHYRQCMDKVKTHRRILQAARSLAHVRIVGGKQVVNLVEQKAPDKGDALAAERDRLECNWVLFVGDDETDEDAFALDGNVVAVRVGRNRRSRARYYLRTQAEIEKFLELLYRLRNNGTAR
jgi:trehalose 6-phosphate phosphatase